MHTIYFQYHLDTRTNSCYKFHTAPRSFARANFACSAEGGHLAIINNETEVGFSFVGFSSSSILYPATKMLGYFWKDVAFVGFSDWGIPLSKIPISWAENEPDNFDNKERCLTFNRDGDLADRPCQGTRPYICYRSGDKESKFNMCGTIDPEYHFDVRTGKCYKFHTVARNFSRANFACSAEGGHLAIINSELESAVISDVFNRYPESKLFGSGSFLKNFSLIGFSDWDERGDWRTIHGEQLVEAGFSTFDRGEPNNAGTEYCGSVSRNGLLNDLKCMYRYTFIFEKSPDCHAACETIGQNKQ